MIDSLRARRLKTIKPGAAVEKAPSPSDADRSGSDYAGNNSSGNNHAGNDFSSSHSAGSLPAALSETVWEITVRPVDPHDAAWRERLLAQVRGALEKKLNEDPGASELTLRSPLGTVEVRPREPRDLAGRDLPGKDGPIRLTFAPAARNLATPAKAGDPSAADVLPMLRLPDEPTRQLGKRLVGLDAVQQDILLRWDCHWDTALEAWSRKTGSPLPPALRDQLQTGHVLEVFHGDPGVGKSALARIIANEYCRRHAIEGTVVMLSTQVRGEGLVGAFSQRVRAAFMHLAGLPEDELKLLLVDEADSLAMRRSETQSHQEDRAATSTLLQCLDAAAGRRRFAVTLTTNLPGSLDAAVLRRGHLVAFPRPDTAARQALLARWLPQLTVHELERAAQAADGMTPADMDRALEKSWLEAVSAETQLTAAEATAALRRTMRTGCV